MISRIEGLLLEIEEKAVIVSVGGIGFRVFTPDRALATFLVEKPKKINLFTSLVVREDALELFGFETKKDLELFELLRSVSGVGPKSACAVLSIAKATDIAGAIQNGDSGLLTRVSGIGKRTAEKIVVELKDTITKYGLVEDGGTGNQYNKDAFDALLALGYTERDVREAMQKINNPELNSQEIIKEVLKNLN